MVKCRGQILRKLKRFYRLAKIAMKIVGHVYLLRDMQMIL